MTGARNLPEPQRISEIDVLWINAGLSCDGDTIAMTAATQPSIEDIVRGALPWIPKVQFSQSVSRLRKRRRISWPLSSAAKGKLAPFILVVEGSIPDETNKNEGYWASFGTDAKHRPADHHLRLDRSAGAEGLGDHGGRNLRHLRRHSRDGRESDGLHGPCRLSRLELEIERRDSHRLHPRMPRAARQFHGDAAVPAAHGRRTRADDPAGRCAAPNLAVRADGARRLRPRRILRAGANLPKSMDRRTCIVKLGCWGPVVQCNVGKRGWMGGIGGCPNVGGICIGCTMPGFPDKFMPFMNQPPGSLLSSRRL